MIGPDPRKAGIGAGDVAQEITNGTGTLLNDLVGRHDLDRLRHFCNWNAGLRSEIARQLSAGDDDVPVFVPGTVMRLFGINRSTN